MLVMNEIYNNLVNSSLFIGDYCGFNGRNMKLSGKMALRGYCDEKPTNITCAPKIRMKNPEVRSGKFHSHTLQIKINQDQGKSC